jgi:uncharacterized protein YprB with RNaseH-like and TPR domain
MPSEELRKRLETLNRGPLSSCPAEQAPTPEKTPYGRYEDESVLKGEPSPLVPVTASETPAALCVPRVSSSLQVCLPGAVRIAPGGGLYYYVQRRIGDHAPWAEKLGDRIGSALEHDALAACLHRPCGFAPNRALFLDLETLGLHNAPLFLIGLLRIESKGALVCHQLLARNQEEEASVVEAFCEMLKEIHLLVTFNGIGFDLPLLRARAGAHGMALPPIAAHLDLLPEARSRYRYLLPNCKLKTLEQSLCGRRRDGDIAGAEIPPAYQHFVRTGDASRLADILHHNLLDLVTTAELLALFWDAA